MKINIVTDEYIIFDNGNMLTYAHLQDCCEHNYALFSAIDDIARGTEFNEYLIFESIDDSGFRFGNKDRMFFVPCYSEQNGYYSNTIDIVYNNEVVEMVRCELIEE